MGSKSTRHNGLAIRYLRIKSGLRPGELASGAVVSYQHLDNIENERKEASVEVLHRIAAALDVPVRTLLRDPSFLAAEPEASVS